MTRGGVPLGVLATGAVIVAGGGPVWMALVIPALTALLLLIDRARLQRERDALLSFALTDPLTGLANRRSLLSRADYEIARHVRDGRSFAVVMIDLDGFKALNDRFGHAAGDELLCDVGGSLLAALRAQDTVARLGGDEFCVMAPETDRGGTRALAHRVTRAVSRASAGVDALEATIGIALFPEDGRTVGQLMHVADQRLIAAKRAARAQRSSRRAA